MITAQDIREKAFDKQRIGGYDMASVDDFLEELADDITAYQKENAVLKSKMKVLVDKIEEYRANEEALNMAVLSAQKLAVQIEADARTRSAAMIADADKQVKAAVGSISEQADAEQQRLDAAKAATAKFLNGVRAMCNTQLKNIDAFASGLDLPAQSGITDGSETSASRIQANIAGGIDSAEESAASARQRRLDSTQPFSL